MRAIALAITAIAAANTAHAVQCTSPLDTRCPPSYWNRTADRVDYWVAAGPLARALELRNCAHGMPSGNRSCQAAAAATRMTMTGNYR